MVWGNRCGELNMRWLVTTGASTDVLSIGCTLGIEIGTASGG